MRNFRRVRSVTSRGMNVNVGSTTIREIAIEFLDKAQARGMASYGRPLEDADDGRDWLVEVIEELTDALQYASKEIRDLRKRLND